MIKILIILLVTAMQCAITSASDYGQIDQVRTQIQYVHQGLSPADIQRLRCEYSLTPVLTDNDVARFHLNSLQNRLDTLLLAIAKAKITQILQPYENHHSYDQVHRALVSLVSSQKKQESFVAQPMALDEFESVAGILNKSIHTPLEHTGFYQWAETNGLLPSSLKHASFVDIQYQLLFGLFSYLEHNKCCRTNCVDCKKNYPLKKKLNIAAP